MKGYIIAEAGVNHNGDLELANKLVDSAAELGADAVKFQTFCADAVVTGNAPKADYQKRTTDENESQKEMLQRLELPREWHYQLKKRANNLGIDFLSTAFDEDSLDFLVRNIGIQSVKIPSGELTNGPLVLAAARTGLNLIVSTGMASMADIKCALEVIAFGLMRHELPPSTKAFKAALQSQDGRLIVQKKVTLLQCTTEYPASPEEANLIAMQNMGDEFKTPVGFSDHTLGTAVAIAAAARGAVIIEKHFTLDRTLPGPDHKVSLEPKEMGAMINDVRIAWRALGDGNKKAMPGELKNMTIARRSLIAARSLKKGDIIQSDDLIARRPGTGISPMKYWSFIDTPAEQDYVIGELIRPKTN